MAANTRCNAFRGPPGIIVVVTKNATADERARAQRLIEAERTAEALFDEVSRRGLVAPGRWESAVSNAVRDLGAELFGTSRHWHKRVVRAGPNTLAPFQKNPPDRRIAADDIVFLDLGPIFDEWEADLGRTYVLGDDPAKHRLAGDLRPLWEAGRAHFESHPQITGEQLYAAMVDLAAEAGWQFGSPIAGHLVGDFPHEQIDDDRRHGYITPGNDTVMRTRDAAGNTCHWILEIHLVDRSRQIGGFFEQLLTLRPGSAPGAG